MRSFISTVILSLFMFVGMSFAQEDVPDEGAATTSESVSVAKAEKGKIAHIEKKWYIGGTEVSPDAVVATLNSNPEAADEYGTGRMFYYPGLVLGGIGGFAVGYGVVAWIRGEDYGMPLTLGGVGVVGIALLLGYISGNYTDSAIEIYNKSLSAESAFKIELVPTVQGGVALAFAF
jgi:hypothetical protein